MKYKSSAFLSPFLPEFSDPPNPENLRSHSSNLMKFQPHYSQYILKMWPHPEVHPH